MTDAGRERACAVLLSLLLGGCDGPVFIWTIKDIVGLTLLGLVALFFGGLFLLAAVMKGADRIKRLWAAKGGK